MGWLFALTLLLNALLLFLVQPLVAKLLLPYLGGTPAVWNTCMVFFQALLLGGYAYAHLVTTKLKLKPQIALHLSLFALAMLSFPIEISDGAVSALDGQTQPLGWLLWRLLALVGLPFLMLATGGPLLQKWFSQTTHRDARDPYFLYSASNVGSLLALLGYPLLLEPLLRLRQQSLLWAASYAALLLLLLACAVVRWRAERSAQTVHAVAIEAAPPLTLKRRLSWVALSFVPSSLMLGVTTYLTSDISPIPLFWVVPLALYLLTFILAFARKQLLSLPRLSKYLLLLGFILLFLILAGLRHPIWLLVFLHLDFFFLTALIGHTRLAQDRPPAAQLTEFYLWLSVGGVLGGIFNSLLAPLLFSTIVEYPLAVVLALMLRVPAKQPQTGANKRWPAWMFDLLWPVGAGALAFVFVTALPRLGLIPFCVLVFSLALPGLLAVAAIAFPLRFALTIGATILGINTYLTELQHGRTLLTERNFFGTLRVAEDHAGKARLLYHGNTIHGRQFLDSQRRCEPLSYYHQQSPLGEALAAFASPPASPNFAVVGLGTGAIATYSQPGQQWTYYEINPAVLDVASRNEYFTYLNQCTATPVKTILGDARLQLRHAPDGHYGLIVLDAFSSDAVPAHLLTQQALQLYLAKLAPGGRLLFHTSNHYLDLQRVIAALARSENLVCLASAATKQKENLAEGQDSAYWMALARTEAELGALLSHPHWRRVEVQAAGQPWSDDYSNFLSVFKWSNN
jgi:SAM-dependent methyltransferase/FtsH-binding integral membrane protein